MARPSSDQLDLLAMIEADAQAEIDGRRQAEEDAYGVPRLFSTSHPRACDYVLAFESWCERWGHFGSRATSRAWVPAELWMHTRVVETTELCQPLVLQADLRCHCVSNGCSCVGGLVYRSICTRCGWHSGVVSSDTAAATMGLDHAHEGWRDMPIMRPAPFDESTDQGARREWEREVCAAYGTTHPQGFPVITDRRAPGLRAVPGRSPWGGYDIAADTIERHDTLW